MDSRQTLLRTSPWWMLPVCFLLTTAIFIMDLNIPLGVAGGILYIVPVLLFSLLPFGPAIFVVGLVCSILIISGLYYSPKIDFVTWKVLANRSLAIFVIWVTVILCYLHNKYREQWEAARAQIRVLEGILPICMDCKKIRDEDGNWFRFENYISKHSEANFSHGYCPECGSEALEDIKRKLKKTTMP
jgi:K+-sensing histidine kinase KdpD